MADAVSGAAVVVDVSNSPSFDDAAAVLEFFSTSTRNLLEAEAAAGVGHHVVMSVVGADRLPDSGYLRAKVAQEALIADSSIPYSIVRATQFFEFIDSIAAAATDGDTVRVSPMLIQPMAVDDVVGAVGKVAVAAPLNGTIEIAGPDTFPLDQLVRRALGARHDPRLVVADPHAQYFGTELGRAEPRRRVPTPSSAPPGSRTGSRSPWPRRSRPLCASAPRETHGGHAQPRRRSP